MPPQKKAPPGQPTPPSPKGQTATTPMTLQDLLAQQSQALNSIMAGGATQNTGKIANNSIVYVGIPPGTSKEARTRGSAMQSMTYQQAQDLPVQWAESDPERLQQFVNSGILRKVPNFNAGMGMPDILSAWDDALQSAWAMSKASGNKVQYTPFDVINSYSNSTNKFGVIKQGDWEIDAATGERIRYIGKTTKTTTSKSVDLSSAEDVKALTTSVLTQALGRAPTASEVAQYKSTINAQEQANPELTTTTSTLTPDIATGNVDTTAQSSTTTGGFDAAAQQQLVLDKARQGPEFGKYQSATTYWNAMMQMLGGGG